MKLSVLHFFEAVFWIAALLPSSFSEGANESNLTTDQLSSVGDMNCTSNLREFDSRIHKKKYRIAVYSISGFESAFKEYNLTFAEYLTETAGRRFDPPIEFEMVPTLMHGLYDAAEEEEIDFFYANPAMYSCLGVEYGAQPLATIISRVEARGHTYDLDVFGGVMFTQADNDEVNTILDFKDKIIGAGSLAMIMAGQMQFFEMITAGLSYVMDPKQVVFTHNQDYVIDGVINGEFDVGFVRTNQIEGQTDAKGNALDPDIFKIIEPKIFVLDDGNLFPFLHSTDIYPEWPVAALRHVPKDVSEEVQRALLALSAHVQTGEALHGCKNNCESLLESHATRCDTTIELAELAYEASRAGKLAGFRNARSYFEVRTMQESAGFIQQDEKGNWKCTRAASFYDDIDCPAGHYKIPEDEFDRSCSDLGLTCKDGYDCYCKPCVKAFQVDVFQYTGDHIDDSSHRGCDKMSLCGSVEQTKEITFRAIDNKQREGATVTAKMHIGQQTTELDVRQIENLSNDEATEYVYEFHWSENTLGVGILEVYIDGEQIPTSPIRVQVVERRCELDYPGEGKTSSASGNCVCGEGTIPMRGKCVSSTVISIVFALAALAVISFFGVLYLRYKNRKADEMWQVNVEELHFDDPVEVIGSGSFGEVLLADYRGTKVAIKRAVKSNGKRGSTKSASRSNKKHAPVTGSGSVEVVSSGWSNGVSDSSSGTPDTHETPVDIECQSEDFENASGDNFFPQGRSHKSADGFSIAFLTDDYGQASKWAWLFPWLKQRDYQYRFKQSILGGASASASRLTLTAAFCPCVDKNAREREEFISEMRVLSRLRHPCITTVMGAVVAYTHDPMLVMEYMEYGSLHDLLRNDTMYLSGEIIMQVSRDIAQGLRYLHSSRPPILHGDLKARNILIDSRFRAKLCDFGLSNKTKNTVTGTPFWLAPEYLRGQNDYNCACDMYSVGIILFEIYSRKNPYEGENFRDVLRKVCDRRVNKRPKIPATAPPKMADLMKKCWSPDPHFRPQAKDLDATLMDMGIHDAEPLNLGDQDQEMKKRTTTDMLYEIFPRHIAEALKAGKKVEPESHDLVTVVFSDIVHFTDISREISPLKVSTMLDRLYLAFDRIARKHQVFKVETIGDAYMGVTNLENNQEDTHVKQVAEFAIDMIDEAGKILVDEEDPSKGFINIRVGFHSGPVVSNVIGSLNPRYGLFGDTVNTASRMESNSKGNRILCSEKSYKLLKEQDRDIPVSKRGKIRVKGKGDMTVYWVGFGSRKTDTPEQARKRVEFADDVPVSQESPAEEVPAKDADLPAVNAVV